MNFQLAYVKNPQQIILKNFTEENSEVRGKIMDIDELSNLDLQCLILPESLLEDTEFLGNLKTTVNKAPIRTAEEWNLNADQFEKMEAEEATPFFNKVYNSWILQNNLSLLEEYTKVVKHLNGLWPNDRTAFFEELWDLFKRNLGTKELTLVYNDVEKAKKEGEKNKLIKVKVHGKHKPNPEVGGEFEEKLMENYEKVFQDEFEVTEFNKENGNLVAIFKIKKSPVVLMANVYGLTRLQKSLMKSIIDGLQENWI